MKIRKFFSTLFAVFAFVFSAIAMNTAAQAQTIGFSYGQYENQGGRHGGNGQGNAIGITYKHVLEPQQMVQVQPRHVQYGGEIYGQPQIQQPYPVQQVYPVQPVYPAPVYPAPQYEQRGHRGHGVNSVTAMTINGVSLEIDTKGNVVVIGARSVTRR